MKKAGKKLCYSNDHTGISENQDHGINAFNKAIRPNYIPLSSITIIYAHI